MYEAMGMDPGPFKDVVVYSPAMPNSDKTWSTREDIIPLQWDLNMVWNSLSYFFSPERFYDEITQSFLAEFEAHKLKSSHPGSAIESFGALEKWFDAS